MSPAAVAARARRRSAVQRAMPECGVAPDANRAVAVALRLAAYTTSSPFASGSGGNGACGSVWYQNAVEAMSSWRGW